VVMGTNPDHPTHVWRVRGFAPCCHTSSLSLTVVGQEVGSGQEVGRPSGRLPVYSSSVRRSVGL